jgi:hypothetical protein
VLRCFGSLCKKYRNGCTDKHALAEAKSRILGLILEDVPINKTVARYIENRNRSNPSLAHWHRFQPIQTWSIRRPERIRNPGPLSRLKKGTFCAGKVR